MIKSIPILLIVLLIAGLTASAQDLRSCFAKLSDNDKIWGDSTEIKRPGDGRPWVIVVFKTCCATNIRAVRWMNDTQKIFGDSVGFLGINSDMARSLSKVRPWLSANKVTFSVFQDPSHEVINALHIIAVPSIIVLNAAGGEDFRSAGFFGGRGDVIQEKLRKLLASETGSRGSAEK
ncbi:MAG: hypothetical protein NTW14_08470 [bacterium]|nr:hypothetical protein [bacterium]